MTIRVMLVDDHRIVREGLAYMLADVEGIELVGEADGGGEFLEVLDQIDPDVVLLDVHMPTMSGLEVLERLQGRDTRVRVVMLSMYDQSGYVQQAVQLGAMGYLLKSVSLEELVRAITLVASGKPYVQGELATALVTPSESTDLPKLSPRELQILKLLSSGLGNKQIARRLDISEATVKTHVKSLFARLGVSTRTAAAASALRLGLID